MYGKSFINMKFMVHERFFSNQNIYMNQKNYYFILHMNLITTMNQINILTINIHILTAFNVNLMLIIKYTRVKNNIGQ